MFFKLWKTSFHNLNNSKQTVTTLKKETTSVLYWTATFSPYTAGNQRKSYFAKILDVRDVVFREISTMSTMMNWKNDSNTPITKQEKVSDPKHSFTDLPTILRILFIDITEDHTFSKLEYGGSFKNYNSYSYKKIRKFIS